MTYASLRTCIGPREKRVLLFAIAVLLVPLFVLLAEPAVVSGEETAAATSTDAEKQEAVRIRKMRRAFNGAPPVIPHEVSQRYSDDCIGCHEDGGDLGDGIASKISHDHYLNCLQCHVPSVETVLGPPDERENSFQGLAEPAGGERAWQGAPPTVPHTTRMRKDCLSCHGEYGKEGMKTPHPERTSCRQCHGLSAELDQRL